MGKRSRAYGLMIGITAGFAVWGSIAVQPCAVSGQGERTTWEQEIETFREQGEETFSGEERKKVTGEVSEEDLEAQKTDNICPEPRLHAVSAVLMDGSSGRILYGKEEQSFRPMASTTKIMTCILALENGNPEELCCFSEKAAAQPKVHLGVPAGTQFRLQELLYSLMLESHNDSAVAIAEHIGGSVEGFAAMMNQKARDIGCKNTWFITPNGLDAVCTMPDGGERSHGTTAADLASILRYCIRDSPKKEAFLEITGTSGRTIVDCSGRFSYYCRNHNALLTMMEGAVTGKTGFTGGAGYSYVGALESQGRIFIIALLGSGWPPHKAYKWEDARALFEYGKEHYHERDVFEKEPLWHVLVEGGKEPARVPVSSRLKEEQRHLKLLLSDWDQIECITRLPETRNAPVREGDVAGYRIYQLNGDVIAVYPLYMEVSVAEWKFSSCAQTVLGFFLSKNH